MKKEKESGAQEKRIALPNLNIFPETSLEKSVRAGEVKEIDRSMAAFEKILESAEQRDRMMLGQKCTADKTLQQIILDALKKMKELRSYVEMEAGKEFRTDETAENRVPETTAVTNWTFLFSQWGKLFANLRLLRLAFQIFNGLSVCFQQIANVMDGAAVLLRLHSNTMMPIRYLMKFPVKSPLMQIFILLRVMRMLALVGMIKSAHDLSRMVIGCTKGPMRKDAISGVVRIRQVYIEPYLRLEMENHKVAA